MLWSISLTVHMFPCKSCVKSRKARSLRASRYVPKYRNLVWFYLRFGHFRNMYLFISSETAHAYRNLVLWSNYWNKRQHFYLCQDIGQVVRILGNILASLKHRFKSGIEYYRPELNFFICLNDWTSFKEKFKFKLQTIRTI